MRVIGKQLHLVSRPGRHRPLHDSPDSDSTFAACRAEHHGGLSLLGETQISLGDVDQPYPILGKQSDVVDIRIDARVTFKGAVRQDFKASPAYQRIAHFVCVPYQRLPKLSATVPLRVRYMLRRGGSVLALAAAHSGQCGGFLFRVINFEPFQCWYHLQFGSTELTLPTSTWPTTLPFDQREHSFRLGAFRDKAIGMGKFLAQGDAVRPLACRPSSIGVEADDILQASLIRPLDQGNRVVSVTAKQYVHDYLRMTG